MSDNCKTVKEPKIRVGVLASGGNAPGMNACIRAVVRTGIGVGFEMVGIKRGYNGLLDMNVDPTVLDENSVSDIIQKGDTYLYAGRCKDFHKMEYLQKAADYCHDKNIRGLIALGGDGTFRGAADLSLMGVSCIGVPCTIDNDIAASDYSIGFDTALNTIVRSIDQIRDCIQSHDRCAVIELMGREAGWLALEAGIASGATAILTKETGFDIERDVVQRIKVSKANGKEHFLVVMAEGIKEQYNTTAEKIADYIYNNTGVVTNATVLGYIQRGGVPTARDRYMASEMGYRAIKELKNSLDKGEDKCQKVVVYRDNKFIIEEIALAVKKKKQFNTEAYEMSKSVSI